MQRVSYSSDGFENPDLEAALDAIAAVGFQYTGLCARAPHSRIPPTGAVLTGFRNGLVARGPHISAVHGPTARHVLGAPDEVWRQEAVPVLVDHMRFAAAVAAPKIVVHPVSDQVRVSGAGHPTVPGHIRDALLRSLDDLLPIAEGSGVRMLLENLPYRCAFPFLAMHVPRTLADGYPQAQLGLVVDTRHAHVIGNDPVGEIQVADHPLQGIHLQDAEQEAPKTSTGSPHMMIWTGRPL